MKKDDFKGIGERYGIDPVIARVIRNRDVEGSENVGLFLNGTIEDLHAPSLLKGMRDAAELMASKIKNGKKIRVIADYDVDGVMSCYILFKGLQMAGADVSYDIPDRIKDGYGINVRLADEAISAGVDTIITCDNGISAVEAVAHAKECGMTVIVTDHHEPPAILPPADVIVDPKQEGDTYHFREICGAVVALKFIYELYDVMNIAHEPDLFIEYAALATVCDIMPLQDENRIIVREGLRKMKRTDNPGLKKLIEVSGIDDSKEYRVYYFSFIIGPSINTIGRLESALTAMKLLLTEDEAERNALASHMFDLNERRKEMTEEGAKLASEMIETYRAETPEEKWDDVLVLYLDNIHESIAGIIAGRIMDKYHRPTIVFAPAMGNPDIYKGSARSLGSYNIYGELTKVEELLVKFGGHEKAAGLSIAKENLDALRRRLNENANLTEEDKNPPYYIDVPMPFGYVTENLIEQLKVLEPCGYCNPSPVFAEAGMRVLSARILGKNRNVLKLVCMDKNKKRYNVIGFDPDSFVNDIKKWFDEEECVKMLKGDISRVVLDIAYFPEINEFNGIRSIDYKLLRYKKGAPIQ